MPTSRRPLMRPAARPLVHAPTIIPAIVGAKNQPKSCSPSPRMSITKAGADAMYRNSAPKFSVPAMASRRNVRLPSIAP